MSIDVNGLVVLNVIILAVLLLLIFICICGWRETRRLFREKGLEDALIQAIKTVLTVLIIAFCIPYCMEGWKTDCILGVFRGFLESMYAMMLSVTMGSELRDAVALLGQILTQGHSIQDACLNVLASLNTFIYAFLLVTLCFIAPLSTVFLVISKIHKWLARFQLVFARPGCRVAYIFSGLGEVEDVLVRSTLKEIDKRGEKQLVIICHTSKETMEEKGAEIERLVNKGKENVVFTPRSILSVLEDFEEPASVPMVLRPFFRGITSWSSFQSIHCFMMGDSCSVNVRYAIDAMNVITDKAMRTNGERGTQEECVQFARRYHLYCLHDDTENELVFDSLVHGNTDDDQEDEGLSVPREGISRKDIRMSIGLRLMSRADEQALQLLTRYPLYSVLDMPASLDSSRSGWNSWESFKKVWDGVPRQQLYVLVIGLGSYGTQILKTAYWMGRMRGVDLRIIGIDSRGNSIKEELEHSCPEMMREEIDGDSIIAIHQVAIPSIGFDEVVRMIPADARSYTVVTLGDDRLNLDIALLMRRTLCKRGLEGDSVGLTKREHHLILPLINSRELSKAADQMITDRSEAFGLEPFGRTSSVFSFSSVVESPWEEYALATNAAYDEAYEDELDGKGMTARLPRSSIEREFAQYEIKKLSNRTCVRHIPTRLWSIGINPECVFRRDGSQRACSKGEMMRWRDLLGCDGRSAARLLTKCVLISDGKKDKDVAISENLSVLMDEQQELRNAYPLVCMLGDLEHERWMAFYRSQGWCDLSVERCEKLREHRLIKQTEHQSPMLRLHGYLCPIEGGELTARGASFGDDPYVYDRAIVVETDRILDGSILYDDRENG